MDSSRQNSIRVLVVDDQVLYREGLCELMGHWHEFEIIGQASNGQEAVDFCAMRKPDLILIFCGKRSSSRLAHRTRNRVAFPGRKWPLQRRNRRAALPLGRHREEAALVPHAQTVRRQSRAACGLGCKSRLIEVASCAMRPLAIQPAESADLNELSKLPAPSAGRRKR